MDYKKIFVFDNLLAINIESNCSLHTQPYKSEALVWGRCIPILVCVAIYRFTDLTLFRFIDQERALFSALLLNIP